MDLKKLWRRIIGPMPSYRLPDMRHSPYLPSLPPRAQARGFWEPMYSHKEYPPAVIAELQWVWFAKPTDGDGRQMRFQMAYGQNVRHFSPGTTVVETLFEVEFLLWTRNGLPPKVRQEIDIWS